MAFRSASFTHKGGTREHNEDALLDAPQAGVWVVADGMGGHQAGDVASQRGHVCGYRNVQAVHTLYTERLDKSPSSSAVGVAQI